MVQKHNHTIEALIRAEKLPQSFALTISRWYKPLAEAVAKKREASGQPIVLGVQGTQGSGKSTLAVFLKALLEEEHQLKSACLSLDDFYLTRAERAELAEKVHPLFSTRGVPGTHDTALAIDTIEQLKRLKPGTTVDIPRFNKAIDDRYDKADWAQVKNQVDIVIFEGWCVGCDAEGEQSLKTPTNQLEREEDPDGTWRYFSNRALSENYKSLFALLDYLVVLNAPSFECVFNWRMLQEEKLKQRWEEENTAKKSTDVETKILSRDQVVRFISHYERLTRHALDTLPHKADWLLPMNADHEILDLIQKQST